MLTSYEIYARDDVFIFCVFEFSHLLFHLLMESILLPCCMSQMVIVGYWAVVLLLFLKLFLQVSLLVYFLQFRMFLTNLTWNHMEHGFQFSSSILETLDKEGCIVLYTWGILGTVIGFGVVCKTLYKNFRQMFHMVQKFYQFSTQGIFDKA